MFQVGRIIYSTTVSKAMRNDPKYNIEVAHCFKQHRNKEWEDLPLVARVKNERAVALKDKIDSFYETSRGILHIITQPRHTLTIVLFEHEL